MMFWTDTTSYAQGERGRGAAPREWAYNYGELRLVVHRLHGHGDSWFGTVYWRAQEIVTRQPLGGNLVEARAALIRRVVRLSADLRRDCLELESLASHRVPDGA